MPANAKKKFNPDTCPPKGWFIPHDIKVLENYGLPLISEMRREYGRRQSLAGTKRREKPAKGKNKNKSKNSHEEQEE